MNQTGANSSVYIHTYNEVGRDQINNHYTVYSRDSQAEGTPIVYLFSETRNTKRILITEHAGSQDILSLQLPPLTQTFVMRKEPWEFINKTLLGPKRSEDTDGPRMLVVTGMGGCGKTQIMLKFIKEHGSK